MDVKTLHELLLERHARLVIRPQATVQSAQVEQAVAVAGEHAHSLDTRKLAQRGLQFSHDARVLANAGRMSLTAKPHGRQSVDADAESEVGPAAARLSREHAAQLREEARGLLLRSRPGDQRLQGGGGHLPGYRPDGANNRHDGCEIVERLRPMPKEDLHLDDLVASLPCEALGIQARLQSERTVHPGAIPVGESGPVVGLAPHQEPAEGRLQRITRGGLVRFIGETVADHVGQRSVQ